MGRLRFLYGFFALMLAFSYFGSLAEVFALGPLMQGVASSAFNALPGTLSVPGLPFEARTFTVKALDGAELPGHVLVPKNVSPGQRLPVILFVHSWLFNQIEYVTQEVQFASKGYIVGSYDCRGWYAGQGKIQVTGPTEMDDLSRVLDYILTIPSADSSNVGVAGISYGGGHALLAPAFDGRVKAVYSMSGWADLQDALVPYDSGKGLWDLMLVGSAQMIANPDPMLWRWISSFLTGGPSEREATKEDLRRRSAKTYVDKINATGTAVYIQNNINDDLFTSRQMVDYFASLTVPKKLTFLNGVHATGEMPGLLFMSSFAWDQAHKWFDYWLKSVPTGIMEEPDVHVYTKWDDSLLAFDDLPLNDSAMNMVVSDDGLREGTAASSKTYRLENRVGISDTNSGIFMTTPLMYSYFGLPVTQGPKIAGNSIDWDTPVFSSPVTFMGIPEVKMNVRTDSATFQVNAFLWDVDPSGRASMLLHEAYTKFEATPGSVYPVDIRMNLLAQKLEAGHKLRLTLSTSDPAFALSVLQPFTLEVLSGQDGPISLTLPVMGGQRRAQ